MRKFIPVILVLILSVCLSACGTTNRKTLTTFQNNHQVQQDQKEAQKIIQGCLPEGNLLTHSGRLAILQCIAPPGHEAAFQRCATSSLVHTGVLTKAQRKRFYQGLTVCVEKNR